MKYTIIEKENKKIGIFSDLHIGISSDSKIRLDETKKCIKWIIKKFKEHNVDWIIFCGDLFNSRFSINVCSLNIGIEIVEDLAFNFEKIFLIEGNHDTFYKNSNNVNSVKFFEKIGKSDNIYVIDNEPLFIKIKEKTLGLFPWGYVPESTKNIEDYVVPDFGFGHFEMNGVELTSGTSTGSKYSMLDLFVFGNMLFSGHYHLNKMYKDVTFGKLLYMIGSPLELDWGDYNRDKKIVTLDPQNKKMLEITNNKNAKFKKVFYSTLNAEKIKDEEIKILVYHNFVKFVIDETYSFDKILTFSDLIKKYDPYTFEIDYLISISNGITTEFAEEIIKSKSKTNIDYLLEYIEQLYAECKKVDDTIDLKYLKKLALKYYDKSIDKEIDDDAEELNQ